MKIKLLSLILAILCMTALLASCGGDGSTDGGDNTGDTGNGDNTQTEIKGYIYDLELGVNPSVVCSPAERIPGTYTGVVRDTLRDLLGTYPSITPDTSDKVLHEIVIGPADRAISRKAYRELYLSTRDQDAGYISWLIYSDGNSIALAYDADDSYITLERAVEYLKTEIFGENISLKLERGVVASDSFSDSEYYKLKDEENFAERWNRLEAVLTEKIGEENAKDFVLAMQELYAVYDSKVISWFANLYDPAIGGYYFSNSGRNSENYLPDIESTAQALGFIESSGMGYLYGSSYAHAIPDWMKEQVIKFMKSLQDPNGFFYHPQWGKELTDTKISRRARDLGSATGVLRVLGSAPTYDTPTGTKGDGLLADGTPVAREFFVRPMSSSAVTAVSYAIAAASYADHLENDVTFREYLEKTKNTKESFYGIGNQLTSEMAQIIERDKQLKEEGATYSLVDITIEFFNRHQDPETGLWGFDAKAPANYLGVNGLLKISGVYSKAAVEIPNAEKCARAAMDAIVSDEKMGAVVDLYNTWFAVGNIIENLKLYGSTVTVDGVTMTGAERAKAIREALYVEAIPAIRKSAEKIAEFEKPDGSFSYTPLYSSTTSQGMPVSIPNSNEGDVNATHIAINGIKNHIYEALGLNSYKVPLFGEAERREYMRILEGLGPVIKYQADIVVDDALTFDDDTVGAESPFIETTMKSDGTVLVQKDPRGKGNILAYDTNPSDAGDSVFSNNNIFFPGRSQYVFEGEFMVDKAKSKSGTVFQLFLQRTYMITFNINVEKNVLTLYEDTYNGWKYTRKTTLATFALDEWFKLRLEYYPDVDGDVRIKVFINDNLVSVSNNYYAKHQSATATHAKEISYTQIFALSGADATLCMDNLHTYNTDEVYEASAATTLVQNCDLVLKEKTYSFTGATEIPSDLTATGASIVKSGENDIMKLTSGSVTAKLNQTKALANTAVFKAKLSDFAMANGDTLEINFHESSRDANVVTVKLVCEGSTVAIYDTKTGNKLTSVTMATDKAHEIEITYCEGNINIMIDGSKVATYVNTMLTSESAVVYWVNDVVLTYTGAGSVGIDDLYFNSTKA